MVTARTPRTIPQLVRESAKRYHDRPAVVEGEVHLGYRELAEHVHETAAAYLAAGVSPGDRVAVWAPNRTEFVLAVLGAQTAGAAVVPLNTRYRGHEAVEILNRSRASALVLADGFLGTAFSRMLRDAAAERARAGGPGPVPGVPALHTVVDIGAAPDTRIAVPWREFLAAGAEVPTAHVEAVADAVTPDDVCDIMFTSGTTGAPKGVMSAHRQTIDVARVWGERAGLVPDDNYAVVNPFFHGFGYKAGMVTSLLFGATVHPVSVFNAEELLQLVESERISVMPGAPTLFTSLLDHPRLGAYDLSSLRYSVAGAATVPHSLFRRMRDELGFDAVTQGYGLTEALVVTISRPGEAPEHVAETTGPAVEGMEVRIVDAAGHEVPCGQEGEVLVRGRNVMLGYFEDEEATRRAIDSDGWLHSGDIGRQDGHGCLRITDRLKDMFTVGGFNVYPAEVENVLAGHPHVSASAVVGVPDGRLGSVPFAFVVPRQGCAPEASELVGYCRERLANFKVPRGVRLCEELPRNASGKVLKTELREAAAGE